MSANKELQALVTATTEIDESVVKLVYANQCIKAQQDLFNKLKLEIQRQKDICNFKKSDNLKLQAEVHNAEHEIQNLITTNHSITSANIETKRELLLAKENNAKLIERMNNADKKYEDMWAQSKKRYEGISFVQEWIKATKKLDALKVDIRVLENESRVLEIEYKDKRNAIFEKDRKQIVQLSQFFVVDMPAVVKTIKEQAVLENNLKKDLNAIVKEQENTRNKILSGTLANLNTDQPGDMNSATDRWSQISNKKDDCTSLMPRLQLPSMGLDITSVKLDINNVGLHVAPVKRTISFNEAESNSVKLKKDSRLNENYISCYFNKPNVDKYNDGDEEAFNKDGYSKKKLINILEDIKLDESETFNIISKANPDKFQDVNVISAENAKNSPAHIQGKEKIVAPAEDEEIEEIDITNSGNENVLVPPIQFLDLTQDTNSPRGCQQEVEVDVHVSTESDPANKVNTSKIKNSQDNTKKKVSFDLSKPVQEITESMVDTNEKNSQMNETITSQLDLSAGSEDNYLSIKHMILKKHNLDLSPQFVYAKNTILQKKCDDEEVVTSKFFHNNQKVTELNGAVVENKEATYNTNITELSPDPKEQQQVQVEDIPEQNNLESMEVDNICSPKSNGAEKPVAGLLFNHGPQGIPECLDISMSTTGYEEGDSEFPTCLDSSLLLSPKADMPLTANNAERGSQEVPNFLSGFRKAGLSFFKQSSTEANTNSGQQNENNFSFNFDREEKKRGGLFSFFQ